MEDETRNALVVLFVFIVALIALIMAAINTGRYQPGPSGAPMPNIASPLLLYVNHEAGSDTNTGATPDTAVRSMKVAVDRVRSADASGAYNHLATIMLTSDYTMAPDEIWDLSLSDTTAFTEGLFVQSMGTSSSAKVTATSPYVAGQYMDVTIDRDVVANERRVELKDNSTVKTFTESGTYAFTRTSANNVFRFMPPFDIALDTVLWFPTTMYKVLLPGVSNFFVSHSTNVTLQKLVFQYTNTTAAGSMQIGQTLLTNSNRFDVFNCDFLSPSTHAFKVVPSIRSAMSGCFFQGVGAVPAIVLDMDASARLVRSAMDNCRLEVHRGKVEANLNIIFSATPKANAIVVSGALSEFDAGNMFVGGSNVVALQCSVNSVTNMKNLTIDTDTASEPITVSSQADVDIEGLRLVVTPAIAKGCATVTNGGKLFLHTVYFAGAAPDDASSIGTVNGNAEMIIQDVTGAAALTTITNVNLDTVSETIAIGTPVHYMAIEGAESAAYASTRSSKFSQI